MVNPTAVIFGANGQDGHYLNVLLQKHGINVVGVSRSGNWIHADVSNYDDVTSIVKKYMPQYIFDFAANSTTNHNALFENHQTISTGTLNLLEAVKTLSPETKVFLSGSGLQFKNTGRPIKETDPFDATSAYAVCRIQSAYAARYYRSLGIKAYVGYFFNHESPFRVERHMSKKIASFVKRIVNGSNEKIEIGDTSVKKEWAFAGDIVAGVFELVKQDQVYEATIGSGMAYSIDEWLLECFKLIGKNPEDYVIHKDNFTPEYKILVSDPSTMLSLGWKPKVSFSSLAKMMVTGNE